MRKHTRIRASIALGLALACASAGPQLSAAPAVQNASNNLAIGVNKGILLRLDRPATNVFIANPKVADIQIKSSRLIYVFGTGEGATTLYAVDGAEQVIYAAEVQVANNIDQIKTMLDTAMPETDITVKTLNGLVVLEGTVSTPDMVATSARLVQDFVGEKQKVVNNLTSVTPMQVNLQVKIAEVSRDVLKEVGFNGATRDKTGGFLFNLSRGRNFVNITDRPLGALPTADASSFFGLPAGSISLPLDPGTGQFVNPANPGTIFDFLVPPDGRTAIGIAGKLFGIDAAGALDALAQEGMVTILAEPNLTALSGELASFLAGGEFPVPISQEPGVISIEFKPYGVGLSFIPVVLSGDRISLKVKPEVSELSSAGAIRINGFDVPGIVTRRAETTVELGSGQSFMIAGLLRNGTTQDVSKTPGLGNLPVLGALFKSDRFRRNESELVIVVTPYLVRPVNAKDIRLPTDGLKSPSDLERWLLGRNFKTNRPKPEQNAPAPQAAPPAAAGSAPAAPVAPGFSAQ